jgi:hypothetical protein
LETKLIYKKIAELMDEVGFIPKTQKNTQQHFNYRGIDDYYKKIQPALIKLKLFAFPVYIESERIDRLSKDKYGKDRLTFHHKVKVIYKIYAEDGSFIEPIITGESMDFGDKGNSKALSMAYKYMWSQLLCIPTGDPDPDSESYTIDIPVNSQIHSKINNNSIPNLTQNTTATKICPTCKSPMTIKKGQYGKFWSCTNYPKCQQKGITIKEPSRIAEETKKEANLSSFESPPIDSYDKNRPF